MGGAGERRVAMAWAVVEMDMGLGSTRRACQEAQVGVLLAGFDFWLGTTLLAMTSAAARKALRAHDLLGTWRHEAHTSCAVGILENTLLHAARPSVWHG